MDHKTADLFCKRIAESNRADRWGIGRASIYVRQLDVGLDLLKDADGQLVYSDEQSLLTLANGERFCEVLGEQYEADDGCMVKLVRPVRLKAAKDPTPGAVMEFPAVLTSSELDRDGDRLEPKGARVDMKGPLLWNHLSTEPIGKPLEILKQNGKQLSLMFAIINSPLGRDIAQLVEFGALKRMSHGFLPEKYEEMTTKDGDFIGWHVHEYEVLEASIVSVASNREAIIGAFSRSKLHHPLVKGWAGRMYDDRPAIVQGVDLPGKPTMDPQLVKEMEAWEATGDEVPDPMDCDQTPPADVAVEPAIAAEPQSTQDKTVRWNRKLSKSFDVCLEHLEPSSLEYDWVSRYLSCEVKEVFRNRCLVPTAWMGSWLTGLRSVVSEAKADDTRNITYTGKEVPPLYEVIQLNSQLSDDFLIDGMTFYRSPEGRFVVKLEPEWRGIEVTVYTSVEKKSLNRKIIGETWDWAHEHNFLKGEAFSVCGEFLSKTDERWSDVFLAEANQKPLRKAVDRLNAKGRMCPNRGVIMAGPPGTGKTLSGRVIRNTADATFIWVSARDFYYCGAFGGLSYAFEMGKELSPAVLFIEDVDNWMSDSLVDYIKTEMDGIGRSNGVLTILTTNYPERLPDALIDRPGRFHDVLMLDLPDAKIREAMLRKWLPDVDEKDLRKAVKETDGYSGAHLYELAQYAEALLDEEDSVDRSEALTVALRKLAEQRELIDSMQLEGSNYRPRKEVLARVKAVLDDTESGGQEATPPVVDEESKGTVPTDPPGGKGEGAEGEWSKPTLAKFTDKSWDDLTAAEKRKIAKHFTWYADIDSFGSLKLPHHFPDSGKASLNGVRNALARAGQVSGIGGDLEKVQTHLRKHLPKKEVVAQYKATVEALVVRYGFSVQQVRDLTPYQIAMLMADGELATEAEDMVSLGACEVKLAVDSSELEPLKELLAQLRATLGEIKRLGGDATPEPETGLKAIIKKAVAGAIQRATNRR